MTKLKEWFKRH